MTMGGLRLHRVILSRPSGRRRRRAPGCYGSALVMVRRRLKQPAHHDNGRASPALRHPEQDFRPSPKEGAGLLWFGIVMVRRRLKQPAHHDNGRASPASRHPEQAFRPSPKEGAGLSWFGFVMVRRRLREARGQRSEVRLEVDGSSPVRHRRRAPAGALC